MPFKALVPCMSQLVMGWIGSILPSTFSSPCQMRRLLLGSEMSRCSRNGTALLLPLYCAKGARVVRDCLVVPVKSALPISQCVTPRP
eukprot:5672140-Pleurochrysis_carterae.AAC.1